MKKAVAKTARQEEVTVRGRVERAFFSSPDFSAGHLHADGGGVVSFAGPVMVREGEAVILHGRWEVHKTYGRQLKVEHLEYNTKLDRAGLAAYLANHPDIKGIGPVKAETIARKFGDDFERHLEESPDAIAKAAHVPIEVIHALRDEWQRTRHVNQALTALSAYGLTHHQVTTLTKKYGNSIQAVLAEDPYLLVREIKGFGFKRVDKVARALGTPKDHPGRIRAGILHAVSENLDDGHCWTEYEDLLSQAETLLVMDTLDVRERIAGILDELIAGGSLTVESHDNHVLVARPDIQRMEEDLAKVFRQGREPNPHFHLDDKVVRKMVRDVAPTLNEKQCAAILTALKHKIVVVSGGAGSGKTFTVNAIHKICSSRDLKVIMAAPTGKAAKRMEQVVGVEAFTLHRLLGYDGKNFEKGPSNPVHADVIIVDEVSMVDVSLAWHLFQAVDLEHTAVVLVGDHHQLPPIGPGNILRDLIAARLVPTVILDQVVRQAGALKENCIAVLNGQVPKTAEPDSGGHRPWVVVDRYSDAAQVRQLVLDLFDCVLSEKLGFDLVGDVQLLTPTRKGPLGVDALNADLQHLIQKKLYGVTVPELPPKRRPRPLVNDKIIQRRNNYDLGVMNGAIGRVLDVAGNGDLTVDFDGKVVELEVSEGHLQDVQLAYALTIHQSQGSEFPCAVVLIHKSHSFMHHRNIFYTGVTRARRTAIIVGDRWGIRNCVDKRHLEQRRTFLAMAMPVQGVGG